MPESKTPESGSREGESGQQQNPMAAPAITLPKGGGAIRGMGEKFAANPVTGTGSMSVPLAVSPGRSGFGPQLSLSYDSGAGNGPFGFGWSLSLPSITRKTDKGLPKYRDSRNSGPESDIFILSGAEDLVPVPRAEGSKKPDVVDEQGNGYQVDAFRPRIEGLFARIERWTRVVVGDDTEHKQQPDVHWRSISKDNILTIYGPDSNSRICDPADPGRIFSWLIAETRDDKGNAVIYEYKAEDSEKVDLSQAHERNRDDGSRGVNRYLKRILYGNQEPLLDEQGKRPLFLAADQREQDDWMFKVVFDYGEHDSTNPTLEEGKTNSWACRPDPFSSYRAGFENRTYRLCQRVLMFHNFPDEEGVGKNCLVRSTDFSYETREGQDLPDNPIYTFLHSATQTGYQPDGNGYIPKNLPPLEFEYSKPIVQETVEDVDAASLENLPIGVDGSLYQWTDLHGEGIPGILTEQARAWFYKRNFSPVSDGAVDFAPLEQVAVKPNLSLAAGAQFMDLAGDGLPDLAVLDGPAPGLYEHDEAEGWSSFRPFTSRLNRSSRDPNLKFVDLDGDGHADILITEDDAFVWHQSLAEEGFGPARRVAQALDEEKGPRLIFADGTDSVYLADLSGDGLTDLVRIRNGEVCYWPNLGHCRFGAKVTMDNSPWFDRPDQFDQKRIRLADIDGSGTTDIIYLHAEGVRLYFNQSGNSWSKPQQLAVFPPTDNLTAVNVTDLLGNGTAGLVWSSPLPSHAGRQMRYVNLMGGQKPHLLVRTVNNMGAETQVEYVPSTKFYLQDKLDGRPWISKLPFPVHVVERVETLDRISGNRFASSYAYHHGYFDGVEREFRGFGMVEQWDSEEFGVLPNEEIEEGNITEALPEEEQPAATNHDPAFALPPVLTKTWFHTGVYFGRNRVSNFFAGLLDDKDVGEYYREPGLNDEQARALLLEDTILPTGLTVEEEREACRALKGSMLRQEVYALDGSDKEKHPYTVTEQNFTIRLLQGRGENPHAVFFTHPREAISFHYERDLADPRIQHALTLEVDEFGNVLKEAAVGYGRRQSPLAGADKVKQEQLLVTLTENDVTVAVEEKGNYRAPLASEVRTFEVTGLQPVKGKRFQLSDFAGSMEFVELAYHESPSASADTPQKRLIERVRTLYRRNDLTGLLPLGQLESLALPGESYKLASSSELLAEVFQRDGQQLLTDPATVLTGKGADQGGYVDLDQNGRWWIPTGRVFFSPDPNADSTTELAAARQSFFTPVRHVDPFGQSTTVEFDHWLLPCRTTDALGNTAQAENDFRVLQPKAMIDPNGNRTELKFDALGLVVATAVRGKETSPGIWEGDSLDDPTTKLEYELFAWKNHQKPNFVHTLAREQHGADNPRWQESYLYSDGFGRELQTKVQAEPGEAPKREPQEEGKPYTPGPLIMNDSTKKPIQAFTNSRWVGTGRTVYNNKGKAVKKYEPFFSITHLYEDEPEMTDTGVTPVLFYDPLGRIIATLHPNHTFEKVVFDAWQQITYDVNDTCAPRNEQTGDPRTDIDIGGYVAEYFNTLPVDPADPWQTWYQQRITGAMGTPEQVAAQKAVAHADTPTTAHLDSLGRPFLTIAHNRVVYTDHRDNGKEGLFETRVELDIEGNQRSVEDAKGRVVMRYEYDMLGTVIQQASMEAGERWLLNDITGKPIRTWDSRGFSHRMEYDALRRPVAHYVSKGPDEWQVEKTIYGDTPYDGSPDTLEHPEQSNHRGKPYKVFDNAGVVTSEFYDFKGNLLRSSRQLREDYKEAADWGDNPALEQEIFRSRSWYDALNRPVQLIAPHSDQEESRFDIIRPDYNEANLLERVDVWPQQTVEPDILLDPATANLHAVTNIDYDAKGQRSQIAYGNGTTTDYAYDEKTFRLTQLKTTRAADGARLQNLRYAYDPAGNITRIRDEAQQTVFFRNQAVEPHCDYTYDALYRLIAATGREHIGQAAQPESSWSDEFRIHQPHPHDGQALRRYLERYLYDAVGNFAQLEHQADNGNWTRSYAYEEASLLEPGKVSNRLSRTVLRPNSNNPVVEPYSYDAHGNMTRMPHLPLMAWDFRDQLCASSRQAVSNGSTPEITYYVYDSSGQRVRKVTESQAAAGGAPAKRNERIYLGGFEVYREYKGGSCALERESLHLMDDKQRIALVETKTLDADSREDVGVPLLRYQLGNHLGSASLELDKDGAVISYEEYHPYGSTAFQAGRSKAEVSLKRYRYTGMERDEETGLNYHGARYYAGWLGMWASCDQVHKTNRYIYAANNPIRFFDPDGKNETEASNRLWGGVRMLGGAAQLVAGALALAAPEPTGVTKVVGVVAVVHGADDFLTGARQLISGRPERNVTETVATEVADVVMERENAEAFGRGTDMALGFVSPIGGGPTVLRGTVPALVSMETSAGRIPMIISTTREVTVGAETIRSVQATSVITHMAMSSNGDNSGESKQSDSVPAESTSEPNYTPNPEFSAEQNGRDLAAIGPPPQFQTVNVLNTTEGRQVVTSGGQKLTSAQVQLATERGLVVGDHASGFHAEPMGLATAGDLNYTPTGGYSTNNVCTHCQGQLSSLSSEGGYEFRLAEDQRTYTFIPPAR